MSVTDFERARDQKRLLASLADVGWGVPRRGAISQVGGPVVYFCDVDTGRLFMVALAVDAIPQLRTKAQALGLRFSDACDALGTLLGELSGGKRTLDRQCGNELTVAAGLYIAGTEAYAT